MIIIFLCTYVQKATEKKYCISFIQNVILSLGIDLIFSLAYYMIAN